MVDPIPLLNGFNPPKQGHHVLFSPPHLFGQAYTAGHVPGQRHAKP